MICQKCGNKNKNGLQYCEKCLAPMWNVNETTATYNQGITMQNIFLLIVGAIMILSVAIFPLFSISALEGMVTEEFKLFGIDIVTPVGFTGDFKIEPNIFNSAIFMIMAGCPVIMIICALSKNFHFQNIFAMANIFSAAVSVLFMSLMYKSLPYDEISFFPNIGFYSYLMLSIVALYSTQSIHEKVSVAEWCGLSVFALGMILWIVGHSNNTIDINTGAYSYFSTNEIIGIAAVIIGGIIAIIGFEMDIYSEKPRKFYYYQTN